MGKLIYSMILSLDGYVEDAQGDFSWGAPEDEELYAYINALAAPVGTYLYGRRMYEVMVYWETAHTLPDQPQVVLDWARQWQAAEKIVFSTTLAEPRSTRTRIERTFDPDMVRRLKADVKQDITVDGPELAAQAIRAGLVDEFHLIICPIIMGWREAVFPGWGAVGFAVGEGTAVCEWRGRSAIRHPLILAQTTVEWRCKAARQLAVSQEKGRPYGRTSSPHRVKRRH